MNKKIYQALQDDFIMVRFFNSKVCPVNGNCETVRNDLKTNKEKLLKSKKLNHSLLIYCIDTLLEIMNEGDRQKIFDFADLVHNMPEIYLSKRDINSFESEVCFFNEKYQTEFFDEYF